MVLGNFVGFSLLFLYFGNKCVVVILYFFMFFPEPPIGISGVDPFSVQSRGSVIIIFQNL